VDTGFLAQASMSHLGETNKGSPKIFYSNCRSGDKSSFWARCNLAQARRSCLSEKFQKPLFHCSSSHLGEKGSL